MLFQYTSLDKDCIRLVRFLPYSSPSNIYLSLEHQPRYFEDHVKYKALSYCWGDMKERKPVTLSGRAFMVTSSLWAALSAISGDVKSRYWIDALCINQQDVFEKNVQAEQMWRIYSSACEVLSWLGPANASITSAYQTLVSQAHPHSASAIDNVAAATDQGRDMSSIEPILDHDYFRRAWTKSEFLQARFIHFVCGQDRCGVKALQDYIEDGEPGYHASSNAMRLLQARNVSSTADRMPAIEVFVQILGEYSCSLCSDTRDRIFAMVNDPRIRDSGSTALPAVDYSIPRDQLAVRMVMYYDRLCSCPSASNYPVEELNNLFLKHLSRALELPEGLAAYGSIVQSHVTDGGARQQFGASGPLMAKLLAHPGRSSRC